MKALWSGIDFRAQFYIVNLETDAYLSALHGMLVKGIVLVLSLLL